MVLGFLVHGQDRKTPSKPSSRHTLFFSAWFNRECNKNKKMRETYILNKVRERLAFERNSFRLLSESERSKLPSFMEDEDEMRSSYMSTVHSKKKKVSTPGKSHIVCFLFFESRYRLLFCNMSINHTQSHNRPKRNHYFHFLPR